MRNIKQLLGADIIHELNKVKKLFSPDYERYWYANISSLVRLRIAELREQAEELERCADYLDYNMRLPMKEYRLNSLLDKLGFKRGWLLK